MRRGFDPGERHAIAPPAPMGRMLAADAALGPAPPRRFLASAPAALARGHGLAERPQNPGRLSADRSWQRMAVAPPLVRAEREGVCSARTWRSFSPIRSIAVTTFSSLARPGCSPFCASAGRTCSRPTSTCCSMISPAPISNAIPPRRGSANTAIAATSGPIACKWSSRSSSPPTASRSPMKSWTERRRTRRR